MKLKLLRPGRAVSPMPGVLALGQDEEDGRFATLAEERHIMCGMVALSRLEVTELLCRARIGRESTLELRAAGQLLRLISLELVRREAVCAAECIQRLEAEERLSLLEAEDRLCGSLRALAVCHAVWAGLRRLQRAEAAARGALGAAAGAAGALLLQLAAEPRRRRSVAAAEAFQWGVLCGSLALSSEEQQARRRIEVDAAVKHPDIDAWLLMTAAHRERQWLLACQRLQRWEIAERRRLVFYRLPVLHKARQQCVRPFLEQQLAILRRRELKARKLIVAWEAVPRALLSAQDVLFVAAQRRRATVMAAEQRDRRWLAVAARCVIETYLNRQRVAAKQREEWTAIVQGATPVVVLCRTISLQKAEVHQRAAISTQWHSGFQLLELITIRIAEDEAAGRAAIGRQYRAGANLLALQGWEFERRRNAMGVALGAVQGLADRCHLIAAWVRGRCLLHRETDSAWARLLFQQLREQEVLGRQELQAGCLEALVRCQPCRAVELQELRDRGPLQAEEAVAFADIQAWRGVTHRFVQQLSAVRTPLLEQEELERRDLYRSARVSQRMAKVSTDLRLAQESRAREGAPARKGVERRAAFLTVPLGDMDLLLMSPARLNGPQARSPPSRRNSHRAAAVPAAGAS